MIYACDFGLCPLLEVILYRFLWGHAGCPLSRVERCPLLGGFKCTISIGRAIGGHEICLLYRGCPPFGESDIRGFTVDLLRPTCPLIPANYINLVCMHHTKLARGTICTMHIPSKIIIVCPSIHPSRCCISGYSDRF